LSIMSMPSSLHTLASGMEVLNCERVCECVHGMDYMQYMIYTIAYTRYPLHHIHTVIHIPGLRRWRRCPGGCRPESCTRYCQGVNGNTNMNMCMYVYASGCMCIYMYVCVCAHTTWYYTLHCTLHYTLHTVCYTTLHYTRLTDHHPQPRLQHRHSTERGSS
jgi:hypothetical protein